MAREYKDMRSIKDLAVTHHFISNDNDKCIVLLENGKRHIVKLHSKHFSNYPLLFVVIGGKQYQVADKSFCFKHGVI